MSIGVYEDGFSMTHDGSEATELGAAEWDGEWSMYSALRRYARGRREGEERPRGRPHAMLTKPGGRGADLWEVDMLLNKRADWQYLLCDVVVDTGSMKADVLDMKVMNEPMMVGLTIWNIWDALLSLNTHVKTGILDPTPAPTPHPTAVPTPTPTTITCMNGVTDETETGIDSFGPCSAMLVDGHVRSVDSDCSSHFCLSNVCMHALSALPTPVPTSAPDTVPVPKPTPVPVPQRHRAVHSRFPCRARFHAAADTGPDRCADAEANARADAHADERRMQERRDRWRRDGRRLRRRKPLPLAASTRTAPWTAHCFSGGSRFSGGSWAMCLYTPTAMPIPAPTATRPPRRRTPIVAVSVGMAGLTCTEFDDDSGATVIVTVLDDIISGSAFSDPTCTDDTDDSILVALEVSAPIQYIHGRAPRRHHGTYDSLFSWVNTELTAAVDDGTFTLRIIAEATRRRLTWARRLGLADATVTGVETATFSPLAGADGHALAGADARCRGPRLRSCRGPRLRSCPSRSDVANQPLADARGRNGG